MKASLKPRFSALPLYPLLAGIYPVLYLWSTNRAQQPAYVVVPSLFITIVCLLALYFVVLVISHNQHRAALQTMVASLFVLSYGHIYNLAVEWNASIEHSTLIPICAAITLALLVFLAFKRLGGPQLTKTLNLVSAALVVFQLASAVPYYLSMSQFQATTVKASPHIEPKSAGNNPRDVYFILLDNYGREDVLRTGSGFDNSALISELKKRGFVFPDCAQANYFATAPVMTSILNMEYLDKLGIKEKSYVKRTGYKDMAPLIQDNEVIRRFRSYGYHTVTFRGYMGMMDIQNTDSYISFEKDTDYTHRLETDKFEALYMETTLLEPFNNEYKIYPDMVIKYGPSLLADHLAAQRVPNTKYYKEYLQNFYAYEALQKIPTEIESPKFVYAHIYSAHWPFLVRPDGSLREPVSEKMTTEGYVDAVQFTNNNILTAIDTILNTSDPDPIIILQGDHSNGWVDNVEWSGKDRLKILSAYYLPDGGDKFLYPEITPVNNFRLIFKLYFGEDIDLLPDASFYLHPSNRNVYAAPLTCISETLH